MKAESVALTFAGAMTIAFLVVLAMPSDEPYNTADHRHAVADLCIGSHSGIAEHYHPIVKITVLGEDVAIPDDVGLNDKGCNMRSLHTHSADGKIHAEFAEQGVAAPLEAFFDIWGKHMDSSGFHEHRIDDNHEFLMFLNTYSYDSSNNVVVDPSAREQVDDYEALILEDMQYIELIYKEK